MPARPAERFNVRELPQRRQLDQALALSAAEEPGTDRHAAGARGWNGYAIIAPFTSVQLKPRVDTYS